MTKNDDKSGVSEALVSQDNSSVVSQSGVTVETGDVDDFIKKYVEQKADQVSDELRKDFILVFGVFAAFVTFLGVEVQILKDAQRASLLIGLSTLMLSGIMLFVAAIQSIVKQLSHREFFKQPIILMALLFLALSLTSFLWYSQHLK